MTQELNADGTPKTEGVDEQGHLEQGTSGPAVDPAADVNAPQNLGTGTIAHPVDVDGVTPGPASAAVAPVETAAGTDPLSDPMSGSGQPASLVPVSVTGTDVDKAAKNTAAANASMSPVTATPDSATAMQGATTLTTVQGGTTLSAAGSTATHAEGVLDEIETLAVHWGAEVAHEVRKLIAKAKSFIGEGKVTSADVEPPVAEDEPPVA